MSLPPGTRLGAYELIASLGAGGMGEVYRARDTRLGREVALKVLPAALASDPDRLARFEREARTVASLNHPNIVVLHSVDEADGVRFLTMELVEGESLDQQIAPGGLPITRVLDLGLALADALAAAHDKGVVHRDLKPANVMLTREGRVKVLDFGLAKLEAPDSSLDATQAATVAALSTVGQVVGTVPYMSPEQVKGQPVDARTDIFSLGVVLYELATGKRPFGGANAAETISAILRDTPPPLTESRKDAPHQLSRIIDHCLQKDPDSRFQTAKDVRNELRALLKEVDSGRAEKSGPAPANPSAAASSYRRASQLAQWLVGGAAIFVAFAVVIWLSGRGRNERGATPKLGTPSVATEINSLAVLPFTNMSSDKEQEYFSDGLSEELINVLAKIPELKVTGRTSSFSFKGKNEDLRTIAQKLGVANIMEGSVRKAGDKIRITAQLVKADDGFHLWSETYDRTLDDVFAVQDSIAKSVAAALKVTLLGGGERERPDVQAYDLVLRARYAMQERTPETTARGKKLLERALELAPNYAPAWAEMALVHGSEGEVATTTQRRQQAREARLHALTRALELDPNLAVAHSRMAGVQRDAWDFAAAESSTARALAAEPKNPIVMGNAATLFSYTGRLDEAIALEKRVLAIDPLDLPNLANLALHESLAGRLDEAEIHCRKAMELAPEFPFAHLYLGDIHLIRGVVDSARTSYARATELLSAGDYGRLLFAALVEHTAGNDAASRAAADEFEKRFGADDPMAAAEIRAWRGDANEAFAHLNRALAARDPAMAQLRADGYMRQLHRDPRWKGLLNAVGLPSK